MDNKNIMLWFDLDDTLWDMAGNSVLCLRELYESQGLDRWFDNCRTWDDIYHRVNRRLWEQYGRGEISRDFLRSERFARPLRIAGVADDEALGMAERFDGLYLDSLGRKTAMVDGAREILDYLYNRGYRMGIVSNGFREVQYNKLKSSRISQYFDPVVLSDDAGVNKPDARFFRYAEERAGSADTYNIIIGDNPETDIAGAIRAGWKAIWFDRAGDASASAVAGTCDRITALHDLKDRF